MQPHISNMPSSVVVIAEAILALLPCFLQLILWRKQWVPVIHVQLLAVNQVIKNTDLLRGP